MSGVAWAVTPEKAGVQSLTPLNSDFRRNDGAKEASNRLGASCPRKSLTPRSLNSPEKLPDGGFKNIWLACGIALRGCLKTLLWVA